MSVTASNATAPITVGGDIPVSVDGQRSVVRRKEMNPALLRAAAE